MWELYDKLIEGIPEDIYVSDCVLGIQWSYVEAELNGESIGQGMSMSMRGDIKSYKLAGKVNNMSLRELASYAKSWNLKEACLGVAAMNAYYNNKERIKHLNPACSHGKGELAFAAYCDEFKGKNVTVIGHFPDLDNYKDMCNLTILERNPSPGDLIDSACEYILPSQDYVFITGTTITNKTLPRLLELSKNAKVILVGPSVVMSPIMFDYGVDVLAGSVISDKESAKKAISQGATMEIFRNGLDTVRIEK